MRKAARVIALLALAALAACSRPHGHKVGGAPPPGRTVYSDPSVSPGVSGAVGEVVYLVGGTAAWVKTGTSNTAWSTFPTGGGGGGTITAVTSGSVGISTSTDGGVVSVSNTAPASSDMTFPKLNSASAQVTSGELETDLDVTTAGQETSHYRVTTLLNGSVNRWDLGKLNGAGVQDQTTTGATPTVTLLPRKDTLRITIGATPVTSMTIAGLNGDGDIHYTLRSLHVVATGGSIVAQLNGTSTGYDGRGWYSCANSNGGQTTTTNGIIMSDGPDAHTEISFVVDIMSASGLGKTGWSFVSETSAGGFKCAEYYNATSTVTANVTTLVVSGGLDPGSVYTLERGRPSI